MAQPKPRFFLGKRATPAAPRPAASSAPRPAPAPPPPPPPTAAAATSHAAGSSTNDARFVEWSSPDDVCPICRNDRYLNPKLRLMVSKCYHKMCESCLDRLFSLGPEPCPVCGQTIRKNQFQPQMFENLEVQKEVAVRKRTAKIFNKQREDFPTESAYNDYLEEYESITFSLIHSIGSDLAATEAKIRAYELQNRQSIEENEDRLEREREELERREKGEREWREAEKRRYEEEEERDRKERDEERKLVLEALESGTQDPEQILAAARASSRKRSSARDSLQSTTASDPSLKLKFLANLSAPSLSSANKLSSIDEPEPIDVVAELAKYDACEDLYDVLAARQRVGVSTPSSKTRTYSPIVIPLLIKEQERDESGGFRPEEVWEKSIRSSLAGLWDAPVGWTRAKRDASSLTTSGGGREGGGEGRGGSELEFRKIEVRLEKPPVERAHLAVPTHSSDLSTLPSTSSSSPVRGLTGPARPESSLGNHSDKMRSHAQAVQRPGPDPGPPAYSKPPPSIKPGSVSAEQPRAVEPKPGQERLEMPSPPQAPPTPAATNSPMSTASASHPGASSHPHAPPAASATTTTTTTTSTPPTIPLPSFLSEDPLSSDPDSSSDDDALGNPKPPRPPRYSKSTGLPRPRPSYYYDDEYDPGTAGTKKRGRRGGFKGVPVFEPTMDDFEQNGGFYGYVKRIEKYGLRSGIVKVIPPKAWSDSLPSVLPPLRDIRLKEPIEQHMMGSQGLYRVTNVAKSRIWNAAQWKETATMDKWDAPDLVAESKKGERSERSTKSTSAATEAKKRKLAAAAAAGKKKAEAEKEADGEFDADEEEEGDDASPRKGRRTPAKKAGNAGTPKGKGKAKSDAHDGDKVDGENASGPSGVAPSSTAESAPAPPPAKKKRLTNLQRAEPSEEEWKAFSDKFDELPHGMKKEDYTVEMMRDFERRYWRTLTFGEPPMYGADMAGSLFTDSTTAWNVAHLGDLLPKLAPKECLIPGVVSPYLYFGMWRATFAWHVEDADLYSINYIHFGAPKFWYSVPQEQAEKFERVMEGFFPTDRSKCSQFLRHKAFLASPRVLSNHGVTLNRCAQLPGEFILTYPKGYHSGFNLGYNCAESINFATERWLPLGKVAKSCVCVDDSVSINVNVWLKEAAKAEALTRGEPWPFSEDEDGATPKPDPAPTTVSPVVQKKRMAPGSEGPPATKKRAKSASSSTSAGTVSAPMALYDMGTGTNLSTQQRMQLTLFIQQQAAASGLTSLTPAQQYTLEQQYLRLLAQSQHQQHVARPAPPSSTHSVASASTAPPPKPKPEFVCALCPDMSDEGLVEVGEAGKPRKKLKAHRLCVMFTPATWIEQDDEAGHEMVRGFGKIEKARWKLKCSLCAETHGTKVQCTKGKCAKAFHVTCALAEGSGVLLDATVSEVGGGKVSVLAMTKVGEAPPSPSKKPVEKAQGAGGDDDQEMSNLEPEAQLELKILCRTHNPDWKLQEQARKAAELEAKIEALRQGDRIRVKVGNGSSYDVTFVSNVKEKDAVNVAFDDRTSGVIKYKNILWPESEEVRRKKEAAARQAEQQKAAALDRAAYRDNAKKRPSLPDSTALAQQQAYHQPPPVQQRPPQPQQYYQSAQPAQFPHAGYAYPSPAPSYGYPPAPSPQLPGYPPPSQHAQHAYPPQSSYGYPGHSYAQPGHDPHYAPHGYYAQHAHQHHMQHRPYPQPPPPQQQQQHYPPQNPYQQPPPAPPAQPHYSSAPHGPRPPDNLPPPPDPARGTARPGPSFSHLLNASSTHSPSDAQASSPFAFPGTQPSHA
ncbi:hypothetical protein JCM10212_006701 [Sporobolomyces blumeae]